MSLMINTNIDAMSAHRNLVNTENNMSRSMQRLSSGLRINSAADDAAGLAISQKLTGQVNGLAQAGRNSPSSIRTVRFRPPTKEQSSRKSASCSRRLHALVAPLSSTASRCSAAVQRSPSRWALTTARPSASA
jgi:flagellin